MHGSSREEKQDNQGKLGRLEGTVSDFDEKLEVTRCLLENIQEKLYDFDVNKKNNLIFNGIARQNGEDAAKLTGVVQDIIKTKLKILRFIDIVVKLIPSYSLLSVQDYSECQPTFHWAQSSQMSASAGGLQEL